MFKKLKHLKYIGAINLTTKMNDIGTKQREYLHIISKGNDKLSEWLDTNKEMTRKADEIIERKQQKKRRRRISRLDNKIR